MRMQRFFLVVPLFFILSCKNESKTEREIAEISVNLNVERFDRAFANSKPEDLGQLKEAFPFIFSRRIPDSVWVNTMKDTLQQQVFAEVDNVFGTFKSSESKLEQLFQHLKYYDKTFTEPRVVTVTNGVDYRNKVIVTDTIALIALDNYLGEDHEFYQNIQRYIAANLTEDQIISDLAEAYAKQYVYQSKTKTFLDDMIYFGKLLYFKDVVIPFESDANKIGYTEQQVEWAKANESPIWSYFVERELLYSTDSKLSNRFIANAPFSKFYLELDNESPGRLGQYIGWQIVRAYAENNDADLMTIMQKEPEEIFNKSRFKPRK